MLELPPSGRRGRRWSWRNRSNSGAPQVMAIARTAIVAVLSVLCAWPGLPLQRATAEESSELTAAFARAADAIRRHQSSEGYWKTPVTPGPVCERPTTELNVFTPAVIIDVLDPVARETGLSDVLAQARGYL